MIRSEIPGAHANRSQINYLRVSLLVQMLGHPTTVVSASRRNSSTQFEILYYSCPVMSVVFVYRFQTLNATNIMGQRRLEV